MSGGLPNATPGFRAKAVNGGTHSSSKGNKQGVPIPRVNTLRPARRQEASMGNYARRRAQYGVQLL